ncbi:MAG: hypothetical protein JZU60_01045 [Ilumatobacteraceae bacterium]|jgi:hypothetical protein|nr:hypothetical protein [Ilumatobacteraceae bacterium]
MLNQIIPPEIKNDMFYSALKMMASNPHVKTILEIGSSSGQGSTEAFVEAIRVRQDKQSVRLFCMEVSKERFANLAKAYANDTFVKCYNMSSVALNEFPRREEVVNFYNTTHTILNAYQLDQILGWLQADINYVVSSGLHFNGIHRIKQENQIDIFDLVLIDGSEFTGEREYYAVAGSRIIALDDINAHKCFNVYHMLKNHASYRLVIENFELRHGFAVFERRF